MDGKTLQFYAEHAPSLAARYAGAESTAAQHFQEIFETGGRILDVGCGSGRDLHALIEAGFDAEGVDACEALLREANGRYPALADRIRRDSLPDLGTVQDASFDGILCWAVLMHVPAERLFDTLFKLRRVLRPGGRLLISTPLQGPPVDAEKHRDPDGRLFNEVPPEQFQFLFEKVGFRQTHRWDSGDTRGRSGRTCRIHRRLSQPRSFRRSSQSARASPVESAGRDSGGSGVLRRRRRIGDVPVRLSQRACGNGGGPVAGVVANGGLDRGCDRFALGGTDRMVNFTGEEQNGDVILRGACANCGHDVVRVLETSETNRSLN